MKLRRQPYIEHDDAKRYKKEIFILFWIVFISTTLYWIDCFSSYGISGLFQQLLITKQEDVASNTSSIYFYFRFLSLLLSPYTLFYIIKYKNKSPIFIAIIIFTIIANLAYSRATIFYIVVLDLSVIIFTGAINLGAKGKVITCLIVALIGWAFITFFSSTQQLYNKEFELSGNYLGIPIPDNLATIISYFSAPLVSTQVYIDSSLDTPLFGHTLRNVIDILSDLFSLNIDTLKYQPVEFVNIPFSFNTASIHYYIFSEGGFLWVIIFFWTLGYIGDRLYFNYKVYRDRFSIVALAIYMLILFFSERSYMLMRLDVQVIIFALIFLRFLNKKKFIV